MRPAPSSLASGPPDRLLLLLPSSSLFLLHSPSSQAGPPPLAAVSRTSPAHALLPSSPLRPRIRPPPVAPLPHAAVRTAIPRVLLAMPSPMPAVPAAMPAVLIAIPDAVQLALSSLAIKEALGLPPPPPPFELARAVGARVNSAASAIPSTSQPRRSTPPVVHGLPTLGIGNSPPEQAAHTSSPPPAGHHHFRRRFPLGRPRTDSARREHLLGTLRLPQPTADPLRRDPSTVASPRRHSCSPPARSSLSPIKPTTQVSSRYFTTAHARLTCPSPFPAAGAPSPLIAGHQTPPPASLDATTAEATTFSSFLIAGETHFASRHLLPGRSSPASPPPSPGASLLCFSPLLCSLYRPSSLFPPSHSV